jgi:hypothetical protein
VVEEQQQLDDTWHEKLSGKSKAEDFAAVSPFHPKKGVEPLLGENLKEWHEHSRNKKRGGIHNLPFFIYLAERKIWLEKVD